MGALAFEAFVLFGIEKWFAWHFLYETTYDIIHQERHGNYSSYIHLYEDLLVKMIRTVRRLSNYLLVEALIL